MILQITKSTDPVWKQKFKNVNKVDADIKKKVADMKETLEFTGGVGLAAPQVGIPLRIFIANYGKLKGVFLNPKITNRLKTTNEGEEGCLSVPGLRGLLHRSDEITVDYLDVDERRKKAKLTGFYARIIQHELDHLNSVFYTDRISDKSKKVVRFSPIRIVSFGTPEFGAIVLKSIIGQGVVGEYEILLAVTQPERPSGRGQASKASPTKQVAKQFSIPTVEPINLSNKELAKQLKDLKPDVFVVASYGHILPKNILNIPKYGSLNVHASLLPKYRGASPIQEAILNKEKYTGVTIMLMNEKMDEGDILAQAKAKIGAKETANDLNVRLAKIGSELLHQVLHLWVNKRIKPRRQHPTKATYTKRLTKDSGYVDLKKPPKNLEAMIRAYFPWPGVWTYYERKESKGKSQKLVLKLLPEKKIQLEGKSPISLKDFKQGHKEFNLSW
jgi:methionyl-tRNA formyltransferase